MNSEDESKHKNEELQWIIMQCLIKLNTETIRM